MRGPEQAAPSAIPVFKRPTISEMRVATPEEEPNPQFVKPKLGDLKDVQLDFTMSEKKPEYKPYTVEEYREIQQMDNNLNDRGGLGPSLDDEWERKQQMRTRLMQFAQKTKQENKALVTKRAKPRQAEPKKGPTKRDKMKEYANNIPKPKTQSSTSRERIKEAKIKPAQPVVASYDIDAELQRHEHFVQRVETLKNSLAKFLN